MKRLLALCMTVFLLLAASSALADTTRASGLYTYQIKGNGTITITGFDWDKNGTDDIYVPNMIDGYTVTAIGDEAFKCDKLQRTSWYTSSTANKFKTVSVTLPESIKSIGEKAFWNSTLLEINILDAVQYALLVKLRQLFKNIYKIIRIRRSD